MEKRLQFEIRGEKGEGEKIEGINLEFRQSCNRIFRFKNIVLFILSPLQKAGRAVSSYTLTVETLGGLGFSVFDSEKLNYTRYVKTSKAVNRKMNHYK